MLKKALIIILIISCKTAKSQSCDNMIFNDGTEVLCLVQEIRINEIAYKKCDQPDGPLYIIEKEKVFLIKYKNGTSQVIEQPFNQKPIANTITKQPQKTDYIIGVELPFAMGNYTYQGFNRLLKYSSGIDIVGNFSVRNNFYLGLSLGLNYYPRSLGAYNYKKYKKLYCPIMLRLEQIIPLGKNFISFGLGLGFSFVNSGKTFAYFQKPELFNNNLIYGQEISDDGGIIINAQIGYSLYFSKDLFLSLKAGYLAQTFNVKGYGFIGNYGYNGIYSYETQGILNSFQLSLGVSKKNK
jgi:hypothetical protein